MPAGAVVVAAQGVADEDRVVAGRVQGAVGLVAQREALDRLAALEGERLRVGVVARPDNADVVLGQVPGTLRRRVRRRGVI